MSNSCTDRKEEVICSVKGDDLIEWKNLKEKCKQEYSSKGWNEELWDYEPNEENEELDWNEIPSHRKEFLISMGWTEDAWDKEDHTNINPYDLTWDLLGKKRQDALIVLGWTEEDWRTYTEDGAMPFTTTPRGDSKEWEELNGTERSAVVELGFNETTWHMDRVSPGDFDPEITNIDIPELNQFDFRFFEKLDLPVQVRDGTIVGDDEYSERWDMQLSEYMKLFQEGTNLYLKYEDGESFQKKLHGIIGNQVLEAFEEKLTNMRLLKTEWANYKFNEENWSFWLGTAGTSTSLHIDYDVFNFLWVMEGKKRVVMIPNTKETRSKYACKVYVESHSCWPDVDVLHNYTLPEDAVEFIIGPGQGIAIPRLAWHAVENLEPTIAFGFRIEDYIY